MTGTTIPIDAGQRLWIDTIGRDLLDSGRLEDYIRHFGISGVTANPTILRHQIVGTDAYDEALQAARTSGPVDPEHLVYDWAIADAQGAADLLRPMWDATLGLDGWVSIEVPPALAYEVGPTVEFGRQLQTRVGRPNVFIKVPATRPGVAALEALVALGVPVNATLVFDPDHYCAVSEGYQRALKRRRRAGLDLAVPVVASVFVSRWDKATNPFLPLGWRNRTGLALAHQIHVAHTRVIGSRRWSRLERDGARPLRLVWASTSTKDPALSPTYYLERLPLAGTVNTMPEATLHALDAGAEFAAPDTNAALSRATLKALGICHLDIREFADALQKEGVRLFAEDWASLLQTVRTKLEAVVETSRAGVA